MIHFYDSATPENIPSGSYAAAYVTGFAWSGEQQRRMARLFHIATQGSPTYWARFARCADCEPGAFTIEQTVEYCIARHDHGHSDFTAYANESTDQEGLVSALKATGKPFRLWVAAWDGDPSNRPVIGGIPAWAKQYSNLGDRYDLSVLYGVNDFGRVR